MKLVIGAGDRRIEGYKHHDIQELPGLDYVCDFWDLGEKIPLGSVEAIQMTHVLEHFPMKETERVLRTLYELLEEGGELYIEVPNFAWHAEQILQDPSNHQIVEYAYGGQLNDYDFHYTGFTPEILVDYLATSGFVVDEIKPESSISLWATKL